MTPNAFYLYYRNCITSRNKHLEHAVWKGCTSLHWWDTWCMQGELKCPKWVTLRYLQCLPVIMSLCEHACANVLFEDINPSMMQGILGWAWVSILPKLSCNFELERNTEWPPYIHTYKHTYRNAIDTIHVMMGSLMLAQLCTISWPHYHGF